MNARKDSSPGRDARTPKVPIDPQSVEDLGAQLIPGRDMDAEIEALRAEATRNLEAAQRWQAEFENYRRRQTAQAEDQVNRASERVVERLIPVIDDLERTIDHTVAGGDLGHLLKGVEMVQAQLVDVLGREGVEVIDPFGEEFDPHSHQAVSQQDDATLPEHTVIEVFQKGYRMHGRVLRPAMVVVSHGGPEREAPAKE
jgi:molecular chaperone GrpE